MSSTTSAATATSTTDPSGKAQSDQGISLTAFLTALSTASVIFAVQSSIFLLLRNKLARIYKPKTFLVPERERTDPPPSSPWGLISAVLRFSDREVIKKCGLDAYFFMRYLKALLVIFVPMAFVIIPILVPINYVGGLGHGVDGGNGTNTTADGTVIPTGLDTLAWGNISVEHYQRRWAHLILAIGVIIWVCFVIFTELRIYIKVRQDWLTSAEHRLRASANTVLVTAVPDKWLNEEALRGLFDVFPGGIRNIWLTRDFTKLLDKIKKRDEVHKQLESAESDLIRMCKKKQLKQREKEEKQRRKDLQVRKLTKAEREERDRAEDAAAKERAEAEVGISFGDHEEVAHNPEDAVDADDTETSQVQPHGDNQHHHDNHAQENGFNIPMLGGGLSAIKEGVHVFGKAGQGIVGGAKAIGSGVDGELERTGGFVFVNKDTPGPSSSAARRKVVQIADDNEDEKPKESFASARSNGQTRTTSAMSGESMSQELQPKHYLNTTRKLTNLEEMYNHEDTKWFQFWKPPSGGYASPVPQAIEGDAFPFGNNDKRPLWAKIKAVIPFMGEDEEPVEYPPSTSPDYEEKPGAEWEKWIKAKNRPQHRLAIFEWTPGWLPGLPFLNKKADTIYWCRMELARLNVEIEEDQKHPERFPVMKSAFVQFNNQVAAHMACQSVTHHVPKRMAPRVVEISPDDIIWDNMAIRWWDEWARLLLVIGIVFGMIILWAIPVTASAGLSQVDSLVQTFPWLQFIEDNETLFEVVKAVAGVLPALILAVILIVVPIILTMLAEFQGVKTGSQKAEWVQTYYFAFLFVQVFLVVSIASSITAILDNITQDVTSVPDILAQNLPKATNYFFSYMILQAFSVSSGTLLQIGPLVMWYVVSRILDNTARAKFARQVTLPTVSWGTFFPVYTNFACIALIYSVVAPLISIFAIITFSLLWMAHRYSMLYVTRFKTDTGGVLYPRALNQTFTGLYVMELCLAGLFLLVRDGDNSLCYPQAIIMFVSMGLTALYQIALNQAFGPLLRYLPITFEDEAVLRDQAFQRAQNRRLGLDPDDEDDEDDEAATLRGHATHNEAFDGADDKDIELQDLDTQSQRRQGSSKHRHSDSTGSASGMAKFGNLNPVRGLKHAGSWAIRSGNTVKHKTKDAGSWAVRSGNAVKQITVDKAEANLRTAAQYRHQRRTKDLEAQRAIGEALYGSFADEIEDLTPNERDALVRKAFTHSAIRARRPVVWIPRDDIGISDDEVRRTNSLSEHIWISNEGTALDSKCRAVYGRAPPDFSEMDVINL